MKKVKDNVGDMEIRMNNGTLFLEFEDGDKNKKAEEKNNPGFSDLFIPVADVIIRWLLIIWLLKQLLY